MRLGSSRSVRTVMPRSPLSQIHRRRPRCRDPTIAGRIPSRFASCCRCQRCRRSCSMPASGLSSHRRRRAGRNGFADRRTRSATDGSRVERRGIAARGVPCRPGDPADGRSQRKRDRHRPRARSAPGLRLDSARQPARSTTHQRSRRQRAGARPPAARTVLAPRLRGAARLREAMAAVDVPATVSLDGLLTRVAARHAELHSHSSARLTRSCTATDLPPQRSSRRSGRVVSGDPTSVIVQPVSSHRESCLRFGSARTLENAHRDDLDSAAEVLRLVMWAIASRLVSDRVQHETRCSSLRLSQC